ncbi:MAG: thioredoxin fold domain-containing protein [Betaproteobacteria bacterium]
MKKRMVAHLLVRAMLTTLLALPAYAHGEEKPEAPLRPAAGDVEIPGWFKSSFLDIRDDVREASRLHRHVMLFFWQEGCSYCRQLMEVSFRDPEVVALANAHFDAVAIDIHGALDVTWLDGQVRREKELASLLGIRFTPTLLFLDENGGIDLRLTGYSPPEKMRVVLRDLVDGAKLRTASSPVSSSPDIVVVPAKGDFEDTRDRLTMAIENQGLVVTSTAHVGDMLERTGKDLGRGAVVYRKAEVYEFCSARISRDAMEADPRNIVFCPYTISVYSPRDEPGKAYVAYRKPRPAGSARSVQALRAIGELLDAIAREAVQ